MKLQQEFDAVADTSNATSMPYVTGLAVAPGRKPGTFYQMDICKGRVDRITLGAYEHCRKTWREMAAMLDMLA